MGTLQEQLDKLRSSIFQETSGCSDPQDNLRSCIAQEAPGCRDPQAHRGLLKTWMELDTDNADNKAVEKAVRLAFLAHSRQRRQAIEASEGQEENLLFIPNDDEHLQLQPFSIRVQKNKIGEEIFGTQMLPFPISLQRRFCNSMCRSSLLGKATANWTWRRTADTTSCIRLRKSKSPLNASVMRTTMSWISTCIRQGREKSLSRSLKLFASSIAHICERISGNLQASKLILIVLF